MAGSRRVVIRMLRHGTAALIFGLAILAGPVHAADDFQLLAPSSPEALALDPRREPLTISIDAKGDTFIQQEKIASDAIVSKLKTMALNHSDAPIFVQADKAVTYGRILEVMVPIRAAGFSKVALIVQLSRSLRPR